MNIVVELCLASAALAAVPLPAPQDEEFVLGDVLDELIERTSDLGSFAADYRLRSEERGEATARLLVDGDQHVRITVESNGGRLDMLYLDGTLTLTSEGMGDEDMHAELDFVDLFAAYDPATDAWDRTFGGEFWGPETELGDGPVIGLGPARPGGDAGNLEINVSHVRRRSTLLPWLRTLREAELVAGDDPGALVLTLDDELHWQIARDTGFITRAWKFVDGEREVVLELTRLELDASIEEDAMALLPRRPDLVDRSAEIGGSIRGMQLTLVRRGMYDKMARLVAEEGAEWDQDTRDRLRDVLRHVVAIAFADRFEAMVVDIQGRIDTNASQLQVWYERVRNEEGASAQLDDARASMRKGLEDSLSGAREALLRAIEAAPAEDEAMAAACLEVERLAAQREFHEEVVAPLLMYFDAAVEVVGSPR